MPSSDHATITLPAGLGRIGVLAALPAELGEFLPNAGAPGHLAMTRLGVALHAPILEGCSMDLLSACSGVGKVASTHGALALIAAGVEALFLVGTCGGLAPDHGVGELVHVVEAVQWDLGVRGGRDSQAAPELWRPWQLNSPGAPGLALTADRPAVRWISRFRRARAVRSRRLVPVADMETAAVGAAASRSGVPWACLRVISDGQRPLLHRAIGRGRVVSSFQDNYPTQAGRPAESLARLLRGAPCPPENIAGFSCGSPRSPRG